MPGPVKSQKLQIYKTCNIKDLKNSQKTQTNNGFSRRSAVSKTILY